VLEIELLLSIRCDFFCSKRESLAVSSAGELVAAGSGRSGATTAQETGASWMTEREVRRCWMRGDRSGVVPCPRVSGARRDGASLPGVGCGPSVTVISWC
jgi:hypothetical protein